MPTTPALFKTRFPEFAECVSDARVQVWIDMANVQLCKAAFLTTALADEAELFLVAHYVQLFEVDRSTTVGVQGSPVSMSGGDLSISFGGNVGSASDLYDSTKYGLMYKRLARTAFSKRVFG